MRPLELIDREIAGAVAASRAAHAALRGPEASFDVGNPLARARDVSSRAAYVELGEAPPPPKGAPLPEWNPATREWIAALTLDRVLWPDALRIAASRASTEVLWEQGRVGERMSVDGAIARMLEDPEAARRRTIADALCRGADGARAAVRIAAERRIEAARQLGVSLDRLELPVDASATLIAAAEKLLELTAPFVPTDLDKWSDAMDPLLARDAGEGWPAHLSARWLLSVFHDSGLFEGVKLVPVGLPRPLGATSFARALAALGGAFADAVVPAGAPFCLARAPFDLHRARRAGLFGGLAADPELYVHALGLGKVRAREQARRVARGLALSLRLDAARVLLRGALEKTPGVAAQRWEEITHHALGTQVSGLLAGVLPRFDAADGVRFAGAVLSAADRVRLVERSDLDWFRSPHAARLLREEDEGTTPPRRATAALLEGGLAAIDRALRDLE